MPVKIEKLLKLLNEAEKLLIRAGQKDPLARVTTLRGIYYGTPWSLDYKTEKSELRNDGFRVFTGGQQPADPRKIIGDQLFRSLQNSQDIVDANLKMDFGHMLIGLDARKKAISRTMRIPAFGGTGLEISTWLGDLGGGAANLALRRLTSPRLSVKHVFNDRTSDYGASVNLEGDIAAYGAAIANANLDETVIPTSVAREVEKYLPLGNKNRWLKRAEFILRGIGGKFDRQSNALSNRLELTQKLASQIQEFSVNYFSQRYILAGSVNNSQISTACTLLPGIAEEVASVFVSALLFCLANPGRPVSGRPPFPAVSAPTNQCNIDLLKSVIRVKDLGAQVQEIEKSTGNALKSAWEKIQF